MGKKNRRHHENPQERGPENGQKSQSSPTPNETRFTRRRILGLLALGGFVGAGAAIKAMMGEKEQAIEQPKKPPMEACYEQNMAYFEAKTVEMDTVIALIEGEILNDLRNIRSPNNEIQALIVEVAQIIEQNRDYKERNRYRTAARLLKEQKDGKFAEGYRLGYFRTPQNFLKGIDDANAWNIRPPFFQYGVDEALRDPVLAEYKVIQGRMDFSSQNVLHGIGRKYIIIHEFIHIVQFQRIQNTKSPQQNENLEKNMNNTLVEADGTSIGKVPPLYFIDIEVEAYAGALEILDLMCNGALRRMGEIATRAKNGTITIEEQGADHDFIQKLLRENQEKVVDMITALTKKYFSPNVYSQFPERQSEIEAMIRIQQKKPIIKMEDYLNLNPDTLVEYLKSH